MTMMLLARRILSVVVFSMLTVATSVSTEWE